MDQVQELLRFYIIKTNRPEAAARLRDELREARALIEAAPSGGTSHPRPYPALRSLGFRWINLRAYWISWSDEAAGPVVTNVLHVRADLEGRATPDAADPQEW